MNLPNMALGLALVAAVVSAVVSSSQPPSIASPPTIAPNAVVAYPSLVPVNPSAPVENTNVAQPDLRGVPVRLIDLNDDQFISVEELNSFRAENDRVAAHRPQSSLKRPAANG